MSLRCGITIAKMNALLILRVFWNEILWAFRAINMGHFKKIKQKPSHHMKTRGGMKFILQACTSVLALNVEHYSDVFVCVWERFLYLWAQSSSCTALPRRHVSSPTACTASQTRSDWCCGTSQSQFSSRAHPSPQSTAWQMSPGRRRTCGPGLWGLPVGKASPLIKCRRWVQRVNVLHKQEKGLRLAGLRSELLKVRNNENVTQKQLKLSKYPHGDIISPTSTPGCHNTCCLISLHWLFERQSFWSLHNKSSQRNHFLTCTLRLNNNSVERKLSISHIMLDKQ